MRKLIILLALIAGCVTSTGAFAQTTRSKVAMNLEGLRDYSRENAFIDLVRTCRAYGTPNTPYDGKANLDANGWPIEDFGACLMTEGTSSAPGIYKLIVPGKPTITLKGTSGSIDNLKFDGTTTTADINLKGTQLMLSFTNTGGGIRGWKLLRPGYTSDAQIFTNEFLEAMKPWGCIRFMDWQRTNDNLTGKWSGPDVILPAGDPLVTGAATTVIQRRVLPGDGTYTTKGAPYEVLCDFAIKSGKDIWITIPALADDDFINNLAALLKAKIPAGQHVYFEYANEVWNGIFKAANQNQQLAMNSVAAGDPFHFKSSPTDTNKFFWGWKRTAFMEYKLKVALGVDDPRFRAVYATQIGYSPYGYQAKQAMDYIAANYGAPSKYFYAIAGAPYFGNNATVMQNAAATKDDISNAIYDASSNTRPESDRMIAFRALCKGYGIKFILYEAGIDIGQYNVALQPKYDAQLTQRTGDAVANNINLFFTGEPDSLYCYFGHTSRWTQWGYWGLTDDSRNRNTSKMLAAIGQANKWQENVVVPPTTNPVPPTTNPTPDPQIDVLKQQLAAAQQQIDALNQQLGEAQTNAAASQQLIGQLQTQVDSLKAKIAAAMNALSTP